MPQRVTAAAAAARVAGAGLDPHQAEAAKGFLTARRLVDCLVAPAKTGKTRTMAAFSHTWIAETEVKAIGLTLSQNAARVLAGEGMTETYNGPSSSAKSRTATSSGRHVPCPGRRISGRPRRPSAPPRTCFDSVQLAGAGPAR